MARAFEAQLEEYTSGVDSNANFGLDPRFGDQIKELHTKVDDIMANIDTVKTEATEFYEKYSKELNNKDQFHKSMQDEKSKFEKKEPEVASRLP